MSNAEDNYKRLRAELDELLSKDKRLAAIAEKITRGKATFKDSARYTQIVSRHMSDVIKRNIGDIKVPMGKEMVCRELLRDHYELINGIFGDVQVSVDEKLGIHLKPVKPAYPAERVDSWAHSLEDPTVEQSVIERRAASGSENIGNSMHDDCIKENAKWREQAGLDTYLVRDAGGGCCKWCAALEGRYRYADAPDDVFKRHDNCTCTVTYECGRKRQDVWSKRTWQASEKELEHRKAFSEASKPTVNTPEQAKELERQALEKNPVTKLSPEQAQAINEQSKPTVHTPAEARELEQKVLDKSGKNDIIKSVGNVEFLLVTPENSSPKTDVGSSAFSNEVLERLKTFEKDVCSNEYETALIINSKGEEFTVTSGLTNKVHFTKEEMNKMEGCVLSHNHSNGSTFSAEDISMLFETRLEEIRACNKEGSFVMRLPTTKDKVNGIEYVRDTLKAFEIEASDMFRIDFINGNITFQQYDVSVQQYAVEKFAKAHKCDYFFERRA